MNREMFTIWWHKANAAFRASPGKASFLGVLVVVLGIMWIRVMSGGSDTPKPAAASTVAVSGKSSATTPIQRDAAWNALRQWLASPITPVDRDLFAVKLDYFPQDGTQIAKVLRPPSGDGFWDQLAKSMASKADQVKERRILIENLRLQAAQLKLQTTLMGRQPHAMVNGVLVSEGDVVASFRVLEIQPRRMIVEREGVKLEITMN